MAGWTCPDGERNIWDGTLCADRFCGDGSKLTNLPAGTESDPTFQAASGAINTHIASSAIHFEDTGFLTSVKLNEVENPDASKTFNLGNNKFLTFTSVDRTPVADEGIFNWECSGNFTGDLCHMHQHTGNAGVGTVLLRLEATDTDICPLVASGACGTTAQFNQNIIVGGNITVGGTVDSVDIAAHAADTDIHFASGAIWTDVDANTASGAAILAAHDSSSGALTTHIGLVNEHLDWAVSQAPAVIHADNYTDTGDTTYTAGNDLDLTSEVFSLNAGASSAIVTNTTKTSYTDSVQYQITSGALIDLNTDYQTTSGAYTTHAASGAIHFPKTNIKAHVAHGATAATARATGFTSVEWVGSVEPTNAVNGDTWIDTT